MTRWLLCVLVGLALASCQATVRQVPRAQARPPAYTAALEVGLPKLELPLPELSARRNLNPAMFGQPHSFGDIAFRR